MRLSVIAFFTEDCRLCLSIKTCLEFVVRTSLKKQIQRVESKKGALTNWNSVADPAPASAFLSAPGGTALRLYVSLSASPRVESCRSLSLQTFGPWPASLRTAAAQGGGHDLRGQVEVIAEILDALVGEVPVEMSPGKLFLHVAS